MIAKIARSDYLLLAAVLLAVCVAFRVMPAVEYAAAPLPILYGEVPRSGTAMVSLSGGDLTGVARATAERGCDLEALDVPAASSDAMVHYEFGALPSANQAFFDEFPNGVLPRDTSLFLRCR